MQIYSYQENEHSTVLLLTVFLSKVTCQTYEADMFDFINDNCSWKTHLYAT